MRPLILAAALASLTAHAGDDLNPENMAKIQSEQTKASEAVDKKYGNKKASELSPDERKAMSREKGEAERAVLDKHGVDSKSFARANAKMSREDRSATDAAAKNIEKKDAEASSVDTVRTPLA